MSLSVKTILHRGPNEAELPRKEIRRFEIEENAIGSYDYFRQKIVALYPDLTPESPFRLMWTDEEGDNVCFSSDEELRQAVKFIQSQENKLFKCIVKFPQPAGQQQQQQQQGQQQGQQQATQAQQLERINALISTQFGPQTNAFCQRPEWNAKKMEKMNEKIQTKIMKNLAKMKNMPKEQQEELAKHMQQHWAGMGNVTKCTVDQSNGDVEMHVDIPIHHSDGTTTSGATCTTTTTVDNDGKATASSSSSNVYPNLNENAMETNKTAEQHGYEDLTAEASEAKLNEAVSKMKELGFAGNWVKELLKNVDGDVAKAIEQLNPSK